MVKSELAKWLEKQYINWMSEMGEVQSQADFARWLGINVVTLNRYMNDKRKNVDREIVDQIAIKLGPEIYNILGMVRPEPIFKELQLKWDELTDEEREKIEKILNKKI